MSPQDLITFWKQSAQDDLDTARALIDSKRYHHALFFCQLAIEKLLKGLVYAKTKAHASPIHQLTKLAKEAQIELDVDREEQLKEITTWNIAARYDDYKREFYHKATASFTAQWMQTVEEIIVWLTSLY